MLFHSDEDFNGLSASSQHELKARGRTGAKQQLQTQKADGNEHCHAPVNQLKHLEAKQQTQNTVLMKQLTARCLYVRCGQQGAAGW